MNPTDEEPALARTGPSENATARQLLLDAQPSGAAPEAATAGDLLRQLSRRVLDGPHSEAPQRLRDAAAQGSQWVGRSLVGRTSVSTVLLAAAQAAGIPQTDALDAIGSAFTGSVKDS
jgi:hypothetical protein